MELGRYVVVAPGGVLKSAEAIITSWAGKLEIVAKELYRESGKEARVTGETMASYVSRRRRWYRSLTTLDKSFRSPEHLQLWTTLASLTTCNNFPVVQPHNCSHVKPWVSH